MSGKSAAVLAALGLACIGLGSAAPGAAAAGQAPTFTVPAEVKQHADLAYLLAEGAVSKDHLGALLHGISYDPRVTPDPMTLRRRALAVTQVKAFDQLYYFGMNTVGSWALNTPDGIIQFDTLDNTEEAQRIIEGGMRANSLDPARIKYIVVMHSHADHYGGARYLQDKYKARVLMSPADWDVVGRPAARPDAVAPPRRDIEVTDGQKLTLGGTTVTLYITPGHTPGTMSALIPVTDRGRPHLLSMFGGTGMPRSLGPTPVTAGVTAYRQSLERFTRISLAANVDGVVNSHPFVDGTIEKAVLAKARKRGDPNPWLVDRGTYLRFMVSWIEAMEAAEAAFHAGTVLNTGPGGD